MSKTTVEMKVFPSPPPFLETKDTDDIEEAGNGEVGVYASMAVPQTTQERTYQKHMKSAKSMMSKTFGGKLVAGKYKKSERIVMILWILAWIIGTCVYAYFAFVEPEQIHENPMDYKHSIDIEAVIKEGFTSTGSKPAIVDYQVLKSSSLEITSECDLQLTWNSAFKTWIINAPYSQIDGCKVNIHFDYNVDSSELYRYKVIELQNMYLPDYSKTPPASNTDHPDLIITSDVVKGFDNKVKVKKTHKYYSNVETTYSILIFISPQTNYYYSVSYDNAIKMLIAFSIGLFGIIQPVVTFLYDTIMFRFRKGVSMFTRLIHITKDDEDEGTMILG